MSNILVHIIDWIFYVYLIISVGYVALFAIASHFKKKHITHISEVELKRFVVLIPSYKEDTVIQDSVLSVLNQIYDSNLYDVIVISDRMREETNSVLRKVGAEVLKIQIEKSSKAKALNIAAEYIKDRPYDFLLILDADNIIPRTFLFEVNKVMVEFNYQALQTHRKAKNLNTDTAILDAIIEEMNNNIFRVGHVRLGFSSALIGSGMIFDYYWFLSNINKISSTGEDKELEELLLRQHIHIGYADHIAVWDEKVKQRKAMQQQRRRWIATQFFLASLMWQNLLQAIQTKNSDYILKTIQTFILPRSILLAILGMCCIISSFFSHAIYLKWWIIFILYLTALYIAIPHSMKNKQLLRAIQNIPFFIFTMISNLFHLKGADKKFIHTKHG